MKKPRRGRRIKVKKFVQQCIDKGIFSPSEMAHEYNKLYGLTEDKAKSRWAFTKAMRRLKISAKDRLNLKSESRKAVDVLDITEYSEVQKYLGFSDMAQISNFQKQRTLKDLRILWEWMGRTNPRLWEFSPDAPKEINLLACLKEQIGQDENGKWKRPNQVLVKLGAFNRCFQGILPKGWSMGLKRPAGELKDHWEIHEYTEFETKLTDTRKISREGWIALFSTQTTTGAREGAMHEGKSGILGLRWENINFDTRRCKMYDKGKRGHPLLLWEQVPLDLFPWLNNWSKLMRYWEQCGKPMSGRLFKVGYSNYLDKFHDTRRLCSSRIAEDSETQRPHILRKTHAQWGKRIGVTLDNLCGDTGTYPHIGRYGVGWTDPKVPVQYYLTKEPWEYKEQDKLIVQRLSQFNIDYPKPMLEKNLYGGIGKFPNMSNGQIDLVQ